MNLIVNVDSNWAIGYRGKLLVSIPEDMKFFRSETTGKVVVLGRKTLDTFPGGQPLKNRTNIILTRNPNYQVKGAIICHSVEEVLEELKKYNSEDVYIIGGDSIYKEFLPYCDVAHVTRTDHVYDADAWFPNLEEDPAWVLTGESEEKTYFDLEFRFCRYERREA
ncbi:MAG: dihydrofolate reductase [Clostridiaceae bacterium]|jgi:dihydrofolate reductase|uniref:dihydrofolate reductase n=1 Tax=Hominiventricola aquisgranensis TaxID=3133164 RepID=A0ABV1HYM4_9FIRM|nr:dihydrofolate reductase [Clostridiaceae bacterium]MDY4547224.1 dihydrofolate reductase [Candidatus Choladocola sp.]RGD95012.1 dihydrofolate reductase [Clostridiales bacterium AM23-16LB]RHP53254.1 dihydrofolate reductase [Clostridiaceae bacterium AF31-3BH]RHQ27370.1 dihydrofolate reductase [Clostridiaceae bacterium AF29-16BH]RHR47056.1 dihydrofolate reductase [Clostridiaceae bacterium AF18-31LB]RHT83273.1 dihydrofolate reductase [Clostridiaceae bacterium AM27-36LB]RHW00709.1 dihydrofolate 